MPVIDPDLDVDAEEFPSAEVSAEDLSVRTPIVQFREKTGPWGERLRRAASIASVVVALAGSIVGGSFAHRWVTHTPRFGAREIDIAGLSHTTRDQVLAAAHLSPGVNVLGFDTRRAERAIAELPWVERVHVSRRLPGHVSIEISERTASAIVSAGGLYLIAADGTIFKRAGEGDPTDLPIVTGVGREEFERDPDAARENVRDALALLADFSASSLSSRLHVDEVHRDPTGDLAMVLADSGTYVWLGHGPYRAKLSRLSTILNELASQHLRAAEIHLENDRHPERATVRIPVAPDAAPCAAPAPVVAAPSAPAATAAPAPQRRAHAPVVEEAPIVSRTHHRRHRH